MVMCDMFVLVRIGIPLFSFHRTKLVTRSPVRFGCSAKCLPETATQDRTVLFFASSIVFQAHRRQDALDQLGLEHDIDASNVVADLAGCIGRVLCTVSRVYAASKLDSSAQDRVSGGAQCAPRWIGRAT